MIRRVAYLSMHTCPLVQPGNGDAGGMNVYIHELALAMADTDVEAVVFTRRSDSDTPDVVDVAPGYRVVHVTAGPPERLSIEEMVPYVGEFAESVIKWLTGSRYPFEIAHSHYWLSGWAGVLVKEAMDMPLVNSFHTLGRVKDLNRRHDEPASSVTRTMTEEEVIGHSNCVVASTPYEFDDLVEHYGASLESLCTSPPGINHDLFAPGDQSDARAWLGLDEGTPLALFVGRIQPLKGIDIAIEALARSTITPTPHLVIIGGPSGDDGYRELVALQELAKTLHLHERVHFVAPQPHDQLAGFYRAADVLVMPSRSESFGLVAAEAQACGLPVVAARVGGLPFVVHHEGSGLLVDGHEPADYARAMDRVLGDERLAAKLSEGGIFKSREFSWPQTVDRLLELYSGVSGL
jgi:D-inositol-3-phosphate glycosyltransferase